MPMFEVEKNPDHADFFRDLSVLYRQHMQERIAATKKLLPMLLDKNFPFQDKLRADLEDRLWELVAYLEEKPGPQT